MPTPGAIIQLRVSPADCMSIVDMLKHMNIPTDNLSFASATKLVLGSALEAFRQQGIIPRREGFEFSILMEPFKGRNYNSRAAKLKITSQIVKNEIKPTVPEPLQLGTNARLNELTIKAEHAKDSMTDEDWQELANLKAAQQ